MPSAVLHLCPTAELWTRLRDLLKPSPTFYHFVLTHFRWFWDIINSTFIRDTLMRLVLTGTRGGVRTLGIGVGMGGTRLGHFAQSHPHAGDVGCGRHGEAEPRTQAERQATAAVGTPRSPYKGLWSGRAGSSWWKYGVGPCYSCPCIYHFA